MKTIAAFTLLVAYTLASPHPPSGYGHGPSHGGGGGYGPYYSPAELNAAAELAHRVANEKEFLAARLQALIDQQGALMTELDNFAAASTVLNEVQANQSAALEDIRADIKAKLHAIGDLEADLAGEVATTERLLPFLSLFPLSTLRTSNTQQDAQIAKITSFLSDADAKLDEKLGSARERAEDSIEEVQETVKGLADLVNTRLCDSEHVRVEINADTAAGNATVDLSDVFGDIVPVAFCALQGFVTDLKLDQTHQYGYGYGQHPEDQNIAVAINCSPSEGTVEVGVFDQSQGKGNGIHSVYVVVKACSLGPVA